MDEEFSSYSDNGEDDEGLFGDKDDLSDDE